MPIRRSSRRLRAPVRVDCVDDDVDRPCKTDDGGVGFEAPVDDEPFVGRDTPQHIEHRGRSRAVGLGPRRGLRGDCGDEHVAFVVDVFSRAIVGWSAATSKRAKLVLDVLDALDMALWRWDRVGTPAGPGLVHHSDAGSQYTSFAFTAHLLDVGIDAWIGTVGDALDNALMESRIGLYKTELIKPRRPWRDLADVELATAERVDRFSNQRLHTAIGDLPPHEHETNYYAQHQPQPAAGVNA